MSTTQGNNLGTLLISTLKLPLQQPLLDTTIQGLNADIYDTTVWLNLINEAVLIKLDIKYFRPLIAYCFILFPTSVKFYIHAIEYELNAKQYEQCEQLFTHCIGKIYDVELYRLYVQYMKLMKLTSNQTEQSFAELCDIYEYCITQISADINSVIIYRDYIDTVKQYITRTKVNDMSYYIEKIRSIYQRGVIESINECEALYREWDTWEHSIDKMTAPGYIAEYTDRHLRAKMVARERKKRRTTLLTQMLARPARNNTATASQRDITQVIAWKRYILYELNNQQRLDTQQLKHRIVFIYKQALITLYHCPDIWYDYAIYMSQHDKHSTAVDIFNQAIQAMPYNTLMYLLYADYLEQHRYNTEAKAIYQQLLSRTEPTPYITFPTVDYKPTTQYIHSVDDSTRIGYIVPDQLAHISYLRFIRRVDGVDAARQTFIDIRKHITMSQCWQLYVLASYIEYYTNKDSVLAGHILKYAIQLYPNSTQLMACYVTYLEHINDQNNMRVMLERIFADSTQSHNTDNTINSTTENIPPVATEHTTSTQLHDMWNKYIELERYTATDLNTLDTAEQRRDTAYNQKTHIIANKIDRHHYLDLYPCTAAYRQLVQNTTTDIVEQGLVLSTQRTQQLLDTDTAQQTKQQYTRPDVTQMTEYRYDTITQIETDRIKVFYNPTQPLHDTIVSLYTLLHGTYIEPIVDINQLLASITVLPDAQKLHSITLPDIQLNGHNVVKKRVKTTDEDMDDVTEKVAHKVPQDDIFRARRLAKVAKTEIE